jgi:hypothetical protein
MLVSCSASSSTLKTEITYSSETSFDFQRTTRRCIPEDRIIHFHYCGDLKSKKNLTFLIKCSLRVSWCLVCPCAFPFFIIWFVRLLALRPHLAYCASLGW